jgi:hypothetical protein
MTALAVLILLGAMGSGWLSRQLLLRTLRLRHPGEFDALGSPSRRQLSSLLPKHREVQLGFWMYLWGGKFLLLRDSRVSALGSAALVSDAAVVVSAVFLFWSAGK